MKHLVWRKIFLHGWPLIFTLLTLWIIVFANLGSVLGHTNGHLTYALDDAYIHMAMAKNLAQHGVFGVTPYGFSSSSSSPLWTLLLAFMFFVFGVREWLPFFLNLVFASAILVLINKLIGHGSSDRILTAGVLLAVVLFTPFPAMIFVGMEHLLHILLVISFIWVLARAAVEKESMNRTSNVVALCLLVAAVTMARFESFALLAVGCLILMIRGRWKLALGIALAGIIPLLIYQSISVWNGWSWLPNSILIRTNASWAGFFNSQETIVVHSIISGFSGFFSNFIRNSSHAAHVIVLIIVACILLVLGWMQKKTLWTIGNVLLFLFILLTFMHLQFAKCGHFFRYEAYIVALGLFVIGYAFADILKNFMRESLTWETLVLGFGVIIFLSLGSLPLQYRFRISNSQIPWACRNIYEQQYQMGLFLKHFYPGTSVAVNDIGAVSFLGDNRILDLVGLASADVLKLIQEGLYTTEQIRSLTINKDISLAIIYNAWFQLENLQGIPSEWVKVGEWKIEHNVVCGSDAISFYAVKASETERLIDNLRSFSNVLPRTVTQTGYYTMVH